MDYGKARQELIYTYFFHFVWENLWFYFLNKIGEIVNVVEG